MPIAPRVLLIGYPGVQTLDVTGPAEAFAGANRQLGRVGYRVVVAAIGGGRQHTSCGLAIETAALERLRPRPTDTVLVAGGEAPEIRRAAGDRALARWLVGAAPVVARLGSVCSGAFVLAAAGLLDGRRAATHWEATRELARRFPRVTVDPHAIFVRDGRLWTSAGVTTGIDMALAMVEDDHGRAVADGVAARLVLYLRRPGFQSQWTAELAGYYAPELNIVGAVLGSPVGDLGKTFHRLNGSTFSGLPATVVAALTHVYPELHKLIDTHANATGKAMLARIEKLSTVQAVLSMFRKDMDDLVDCPLEELTESPELVRIFDEIRLGHNVPEMPLLVVQAVHDQIIAVDAIDELTATYTAGGAQVAYHRDLFSEHLSLHPLAAPMALRWLTDRFDNRPVTDNMVRTVWPTLLNPITYAGMARLGAVLVRLVGGQMVRRNPL